MYTFCKKYGNKIFLRDHHRNIKTITKHTWDVYFDDPDGTYKSIEGKPLRKDTYPTVRKAMNALEENERYLHAYGAKTFGYQYIRDKYLRSKPITPKDLYIANIDIETGRDENGYSPPEEARCPVTSITLYDMTADRYVVWGYHKDGYISKSDNVKYVNCRDEKDLLFKFITFLSLRHPDIITGWNVEQYDITYIYNRTSRIISNADELLASLSPFGIVNEGEVHDGFGNTHQVYNIIGVSTLDYLALFKKFTYITPENYKLDTVAHLLLGDRKIDYSEYANLQDLYNRDYEKFIDYNIKDVEIVTRLDNKLKLFDLILSVAYKAGINYSDVVSPVTTWDVLIYNAVMDSGIVPPYDIPKAKSGQYVGAYVKEPTPGMYKWVVSCDLNSLYPHLQMGVNISPEKRLIDDKLPQELKDIRDSFGDTLNGIQMLLEEKVDTSVLQKYNVSLAPNGQFYKRDGDGFIPVILEGLYSERKAVKRSMLDDKQAMEDDPSLDLGNQIAQKNTLQMALKILMNSEYGALANKYFRYFDLRNAEAVTSSGQLSIMWVAKHLNIFLNRILHTSDSDYVIAIDTDSVYLNLEYLVEKFVKPEGKSVSSTVDVIDGWAKKVLEPEISRIYDNLAKYTNAHKQKMVMSREVIADKGFWTGKKRYALNVYDNEGVRYKKPEAKILGLECVRSSIPEFCRDYIRETIVKILTEKEKDIQDFILKVKKDFYSQAPEDISFPRGTNNIEKWVDSEEGMIYSVFEDELDFEPSESFGSSKKSTPIHVRGCIVYNNYLDENGFTDEKIQSGDKVKFCNLKKYNSFGSHVISFPPAMNPKIYEELKDNIDYDAQWMGTYFKPIEAIMNVIGWTIEEANKISNFCRGDYY